MDEPDSKASEHSSAEGSGATSSSPENKKQREKLRLTPEHRRFLGDPRPYRQQSTTEQRPSKSPAARVQATSSSSSRPPEQKVLRRTGEWKTSAPVEMQKIILLVGALMLLGGVFYAGKKYEYW